MTHRHIYPVSKRIVAAALLAVVPVLILFASGCDSKPQDVTTNPAFGNFADILGTWKTKVPLSLVEIEKKLHLLPTDAVHFGVQLHVLPPGTEIHIEHLVLRETFETRFLDVIGSISTSGYSGKSVYIDERLFEPVPDPPHSESMGTPGRYYAVWHDSNNPKPDWVASPDKLER